MSGSASLQQQSDYHNGNNASPEVPYGYLPAYLPGASSLVEQLDRRLLVILRDGRHLVGTLRTFDQFANMVLQDTFERRNLITVNTKTETMGGSNRMCYQTDIELGLLVVRGENVVIFGELNEIELKDNDCMDGGGSQDNSSGSMKFVSLEEFERLKEEDVGMSTGCSCKEFQQEIHINWDFDMDLVA
jgi:U6 snRNA-associated Sm-like protein LSm1